MKSIKELLVLKGFELRTEFKNYMWFRSFHKDITIKKNYKGYEVEVVTYCKGFVEKTHKNFSLCKDVTEYLWRI